VSQGLFIIRVDFYTSKFHRWINLATRYLFPQSRIYFTLSILLHSQHSRWHGLNCGHVLRRLFLRIHNKVKLKLMLILWSGRLCPRMVTKVKKVKAFVTVGHGFGMGGDWRERHDFCIQPTIKIAFWYQMCVDLRCTQTPWAFSTHIMEWLGKCYIREWALKNYWNNQEKATWILKWRNETWGLFS
jgi:hypothetical protein